jgi:heparosan-N-sulfate-glucuronate 5-epimerase
MLLSLHITRIMVTAIITIIVIITVPFYSICNNHSYNFIGALTAFAEPVPNEKGVIMFNYKDAKHSVYNPLILASWGLSYFTKYENTGDNKSKEYFINTANWLAANAKDKQGGKHSIWEYNFTWPWYYGVTPPYYSAYAQAVGIVVLAHAYDLTKNQTYLDKAHNAFQALAVDYDRGGVMTIEDNHGDSIFFHELVKPGFKKTYVLNGHTGTLLHIWQYYELTHDPQAKCIFDKGINYLKQNLWKYDTGNWSLYDQVLFNNMKDRSTNTYHKIHIDHLNRLYNITGEPILKEYADRFSKYLVQH